MEKVRIDKWLWAARFFKTRAKSREAINGGKVHMNGQRVKPSKEIVTEDQLIIRQGWDEKTIVVRAVTARRMAAPDARLLYEETQDSIAKRESEAEQRRAAGQHVASKGRPNKRDRRLIHQFRNKN